MKKHTLVTILATVLLQLSFAQNKLTLDNVQKAYIKGAGAIYANKQVKGYYLFYESDKIDRKTREYTIQILDENSNPVKKTTLQDHKDVILYDAEFNGNSLCFFFVNTKEKKYVYRIYDLDCKLKYEYEKEYDNGDFMLFSAQASSQGDDATSNTLIAIPNLGFASLMPVREGGSNVFEIGYFSSISNKSYQQRPEFEEKQVAGICMAVVDSTIYLEVGKKKRALSGKPTTCTYAFNVITQKKVFMLEENFDSKYKALPTFIAQDPQTGNLIMTATYFEEDDNITKDYGLGISIYTMTKNGTIITKEYNPWDGAFSKFLPVNDKGKIDGIGYLCIQDIQRTADGKLFVAAEGYKRKFDVIGAAFALGGAKNGGFTKIVITDLVVIEFDKGNKLVNATTYKKKEFAGVAGQMSDFASQHALALMMKALGIFDYAFTTTAKDNSSFSFCYTDWEKTDDYKGGTFNSIKYSNGKLTTDKIQLSSKAKITRIYPAKQGYVGIYEYFRKEKKIEFHLEKLN